MREKYKQWGNCDSLSISEKEIGRLFSYTDEESDRCVIRRYRFLSFYGIGLENTLLIYEKDD